MDDDSTIIYGSITPRFSVDSPNSPQRYIRPLRRVVGLVRRLRFRKSGALFVMLGLVIGNPAFRSVSENGNMGFMSNNWMISNGFAVGLKAA